MNTIIWANQTTVSCVSVATCTCKVWQYMLSRICQSIGCYFPHSPERRMLFPTFARASDVISHICQSFGCYFPHSPEHRMLFPTFARASDVISHICQSVGCYFPHSPERQMLFPTFARVGCYFHNRQSVGCYFPHSPERWMLFPTFARASDVISQIGQSVGCYFKHSVGALIFFIHSDNVFSLLFSGPGRHSCPYCSKSLPTPSMLARHLRKHTGERPFTCQECGKGFTRKSSLNNHIFTQHPDKCKELFASETQQLCSWLSDLFVTCVYILF